MEMVMIKMVVILISICYVTMSLDYWHEMKSRVLEVVIISFNVIMGLYMSIYSIKVVGLTDPLIRMLLVYTISNFIVLEFFNYKQRKKHKANYKKDELQRTLKKTL